MRATVDMYKELGIRVATLEAVSENESAISLYQQFGYEVVDRLVFLNHEGELKEGSFRQPSSQTYSAVQVAPYVVGELEFYQESAPWQGHWQSLVRQNGEALVVSNSAGTAVGYALYKKKRDEQGRIIEIALHQCVAIPGADTEAIIGCALRSLYAPLELDCTRSTYNFNKSNEAVIKMLIEAGFKSFIEQVHMVRTFDSGN